MTKFPLKGSERQPMPGAKSTGKADPTERLEVTLLLRHSNAQILTQRVRKIAQGSAPNNPMSRDEFGRQFGTAGADLTAVRNFAAANGLAVVQEDPGRCTIVLAGTVAQANAAFGVDLQCYEHPGGGYRGRVGSVQLPQELHPMVKAVLGLDNRPVAQPHFRMTRPNAGANTSFTPLQIAQLYDFPLGAGQGQCVGIIELGGGERPADLKTYFKGLGIGAGPKVTVVSVDHGLNHPTGDPNSADGEVMLDIEMVGAIASQAHIAVYFAPNTEAGFLDAVTTAIHDKTNKPSVISISWGGPESTWTQQALTGFDTAFQAAAVLGVTICVASGDGGSSDGLNDGADHVDFPASSPNVLACGGTSLTASGKAIASETVWNDAPQSTGAGGGGISTVFALPVWQEGLQTTLTAGGTAPLAMRGVPDVSGNADPQTGYQIRIDGTDTVIGGTSAVAPLWAGLIARINATKGTPVGFINPILYAGPGVMNDIKQGNNGTFAASVNWDACTGLGTPDGAKANALLTQPPAA
ncbi:MAG: kumamolisin [Aliidongia sp.]|nr:kumamolisin [Aliidongia sp.]